MTCKHCDMDGDCVYPMYGLAPHDHVGENIIGSTKIRPKDEWPDNFVEDGESPGCGVYTSCPECGAPDSDHDGQNDPHE